jgi:hypothetical protein
VGRFIIKLDAANAARATAMNGANTRANTCAGRRARKRGKTSRQQKAKTCQMRYQTWQF